MRLNGGRVKKMGLEGIRDDETSLLVSQAVKLPICAKRSEERFWNDVGFNEISCDPTESTVFHWLFV